MTLNVPLASNRWRSVQSTTCPPATAGYTSRLKQLGHGLDGIVAKRHRIARARGRCRNTRSVPITSRTAGSAMDHDFSGDVTTRRREHARSIRSWGGNAILNPLPRVSEVRTKWLDPREGQVLWPGNGLHQSIFIGSVRAPPARPTPPVRPIRPRHRRLPLLASTPRQSLHLFRPSSVYLASSEFRSGPDSSAYAPLVRCMNVGRFRTVP